MSHRAAPPRSSTAAVGADGPPHGRPGLARACSVLLLAAVLCCPAAIAQGQKVLKFIPQADLRILDPITTTAYITRNHGYMIYDTLFATDANFKVQPQMVDK